MPLSEDLTHAEGDPEDLFFAADVPWSVPLPFAEEEMHLTGDVFLSDGPYLFHSKDKRLGMLFSSWSERGYAMGLPGRIPAGSKVPGQQKKIPSGREAATA
jgi:hypothetical protein